MRITTTHSTPGSSSEHVALCMYVGQASRSSQEEDTEQIILYIKYQFYGLVHVDIGLCIDHTIVCMTAYVHGEHGEHDAGVARQDSK